MTFKAATDALMAKGVTLQEIAEGMGVAYTTARAFRLDPTSSSFRSPPDAWKAMLAGVARVHAIDMAGGAQELEGLAAKLDGQAGTR